MDRIALVGNPNCGKTTLFNRLTGEHAHVGNWPGVTVERREGVLRDRSARLVDLPGLYSMSVFSPEEGLSRDFLKTKKTDCILNLLDARALRRSLSLTCQLLSLKIPVVVALGMVEEAEREGIHPDFGALSKALGVPVVNAADTQALLKTLRGARGRKNGFQTPWAVEMEPEERYRHIEAILKKAAPTYSKKRNTQSRMDRVVLHRALALPVFGMVMALLFWVCFGPPGQALQGTAQRGLDFFGYALEDMFVCWGISPFLKELLLSGVLGGVGTVLCFLPQLALLFLGLAVLEECGYLARAAFLMDAPLRRLGLSGKAFVPLLTGFGCTTTALMTTRTLYRARERRLTILLMPFCSCGAKFPIYALFAGAFFPRYQGIAIAGCYLLGILAGVCYAWFLGELLPGESAPFLLELPRYHIPSLETVLRSAFEKCGDFIRKAGTILFLLSIAMWLLEHIALFPMGVTAGEGSLLYRLGDAAASMFAPLGFGFREGAVALLAGAASKEAVVSAFGVLCGGGPQGLNAALQGLFTPLSAVSFLVFSTLYAPCVSALAAMKRELGSATAMLRAVGVQTAIAYLTALGVYQIGTLFINMNIL